MARVEASVEADLDRNAGPFDGHHATVDLTEVEVHGLLKEHRFAGLGSRDEEVDVGVGRRADGDGVDALDQVIKTDLWSLKLVRKPTSTDGAEGRTWIQSDRSGTGAPGTANANDPPTHQR